MASITKRPNGSFQARVYVGRDADGKQIFRCVTHASEKECKRLAREIERELEDGNYSNMRNVRVTAWISDWIEMNRPRLSPSTLHVYKMYVSAHYEPFFKTMKLGAVTDLHIEKFKAEKLKDLSPNSVRKILSVLNKILRTALKDKNPARNVEMPKKKKFNPTVVTPQEFEKIHKAVKGTVDEIIILLSAWCGLRRGEIFALKPDDIMIKKCTIRVDESYTINDEYMYEYKDPKSNNGRREIVVPEYLMGLIEKHMSARGEIGEKLFNYRPDHYSHRFAKIITDNGLSKIRFHDLRHYHASWLYDQSIPDQYAAKRLGHDIQTLKSIYQHLGLDKKKEIDDNIRQLFKASAT